MLYSIDSDKQITSLPRSHVSTFNAWRKQLSDIDYNIIVEELNLRIDGSEVNTSSWLPGKKWNGTVFQPIYKACSGDQSDAAKFFGLILWQVFVDRPDDSWGFGRYEKNGLPIEGMTYFKINK